MQTKRDAFSNKVRDIQRRGRDSQTKESGKPSKRAYHSNFKSIFINNPIRNVNVYVFLTFIDRMSSSIPIEYYSKRFGDNISAAFIHLIREIGEIAFAIEKNSTGIAQTKITEAIAIMYYIASKYNLDIDENIKSLYSKKLKSVK
jgi:hypothetical protein